MGVPAPDRVRLRMRWGSPGRGMDGAFASGHPFGSAATMDLAALRSVALRSRDFARVCPFEDERRCRSGRGPSTCPRRGHKNWPCRLVNRTLGQVPVRGQIRSSLAGHPKSLGRCRQAL